MSKQEVLSRMTFGQRVAEEEIDELTHYFVETDNWNQLFSNRVDVVYGPKGAGKSALYALLLARREELFKRFIILAAAENPRGAPAFRDLTVDPPAGEREFIGLWKLYFACLLVRVFKDYGIRGSESEEMANVLEREGLIPKEWSLGALVRAVGDYVRSAIRPQGVEIGIEVDPATGLPTGFKGKITFQEPSASARGRGFMSVDQILTLAEEALGDAGFSVWLLLDRLDVAFTENAVLEAHALGALFHAYLDIQAYRHFRLKVFLRTDIWRKITAGGFREASHITRHMTISWDRRTLMSLVARRAIQNQVIRDYYQAVPEDILASAATQDELFYRMCPGQVDVGPNKSATFEWVLNRTRDATGQTAPRELIHFLNRLREVQVRRLEVGEVGPEGEELFVRAAFKEALPEVSRVRLEQTLLAEYPDLRDYIHALRGEKTLQTLGTLAKIWRVTEERAIQTAARLVEIGFFELRGSKETPSYWVPFLFRDALSMVQGTADSEE